MGAHKLINNFNGGELSPLLDGRSDLEQYDRGCRTLQNMRPLPYGGARMRSGLVYVAPAKNADKKARLIPFQFSTSTRFLLELGHGYIRFFSNGAQVLDSGVPVEVASPYDEADLFAIQFKQINDIIYFVHPSYEPRKLSRLSDTAWTLATVAWTYPALREENATDTTLALGAVTGSGVALVASDDVFNAGHVGAYFEVRHLRESDGVEIDMSAAAGTVTSSSIKVKGDWSVVTTERWYGTLRVQRSTDGGATWTTIRQFKSSADRNVSASGTQADDVLLRLEFEATGDPYGAAVWVGTSPTNYVKSTAKLESQEAYVTGLVKVTAVTDAQNAVVDVVQDAGSTAATEIWSEGAWSTYRGFPRAIGLYEQRLLLGANAEKPTRFWGSVTGDFENFAYGDNDDDAVAFDIASTEQNPIQWIEALQRVQMGTAGGEFAASSGQPEEPVTPSNISVRGQSAYGSEYLQALLVNDVVLFLQRQGRKVREMSYDIQRDGYVAPDLTLLSEHVTESGLLQLAFARQPDPLFMAVRGDGQLCVMTYNREQNITAWARWVTDGTIESVASIYGSPADEVWAIVRRTVNGATVRYVEKLAAESDDKFTGVHLDCAKSGTTAGTTITGLSHLEGRSVRVVLEGANVGTYTVSGGQVTVENVSTFGRYVVGLPYAARLQPMKLEVMLANGTSKGRTRRIVDLSLAFRNTLGAKVGPSLSRLDVVEFRTTDDRMDAAPGLFTGDVKVYWNNGYDKAGDIWVVQEEPFPMTVLSLSANWDVFGA